MRQLYVSATSIVQIARLLPVLGMPDVTVICFGNIDHPDCKASANFRHADATVVLFCNIDCSDCKASAKFTHAGRDSYTLL